MYDEDLPMDIGNPPEPDDDMVRPDRRRSHPYYRTHTIRTRPGLSRSGIAALVAIGIMVFFVGMIISNLWLFQEEPVRSDYSYYEDDEYEKNVTAYNTSIRSTLAFGRLVAGTGLVLAGGAMFLGGINGNDIPIRIRRTMISGGSLIVAAAIVAMMMFSPV